jgi:hypothetical protein
LLTPKGSDKEAMEAGAEVLKAARRCTSIQEKRLN